MPRSKASTVEKKVVLCSTEDQAQWVSEQLINSGQKYKILAPGLKEQLILRENRLPYLQYFDSFLCNNIYYKTYFKRLSQQAQRLSQFIQKNLSRDILAREIPLINLCQVLLEYEIFELLFNYQYFRSLQKSSHLTGYIVSKDEHVRLSGWSPGFFSLAGYVNDYFVSKDQISHFKNFNHLNINRHLKPLTHFRKAVPGFVVAGEIIKQQILHYKRKAEEIGNVDFLLFSGGMNLYYYQPFFSYLRDEQSLLRFVNITGPQTLEDQLLLRKANIPFKPLADFDRASLESRIIRDQEMFMAKIPKIISQLGKCLQNQTPPIAVKEALIYKVELVLKNNIDKLIRQIHLAHEALKLYQPRLVITTHDPGPSALSFVLLAQKRKIPNLVLIHAWQDSTLGMNHRSDHVAVWGKETARWYANILRKKKRTVHAVGFPLFDPLYKNQEAFWQKEDTLPRIGRHIGLGLLLTLYPENNFGWTKFLDELCSALKKSKLQFVLDIRLHRGQDLEGVESLIRLYKLSMINDEKIPLESFIRRNDIILSWDTTAFLWAMFYGKPLFCTTPFWGKGLSPITKYKAAWEPNSAEELVKIIEEIKNNPTLLKQQRKGQRRFLLDVVGNDDGEASKKLLQLIKRLIKKQKISNNTEGGLT